MCQVCSSCCEGNICNVLVPRNESGAVFSSTSPLASSSRRHDPAALSYILIILLIVVSIFSVFEMKTVTRH
ncbi:putative ly6/PLAUR domain-containing protein 6-like [Scophthalmus maximus]|uniref:Putative ly6/PLAUR domain-containing protein 6-like n=1 Tax=Scophthalmus maximus TaxID=52904 RepID=A0A2U9AV81_SCOMX|nr:putative ly6/PLAUR domain-containing protein 6-like [Scophthalmus maximus]